MIRSAACLLIGIGLAASPRSNIQAAVDFDNDVRPILETHCFQCHGADKQQGGLRFDMRDGALREGDSGELAIVPGHTEQSELLRRVASQDDGERMPPEGDPLSAAQIEILQSWITTGAQWPQELSRPAKGGRQELVVTDADRQYWAFQPLRTVEPPVVNSADWVRTPVDRFILAELERASLRPSAPATARELIRRVYFAVTGLPPTQDEVDAFVADSSPETYERLIDRLLESRQYGERWGRHWLDVARYADSDGQEADQDRPNAYHYRDFVIRSLNDDLPFDAFVRWQLAGDEYDPHNPLAVAATGFLTAGPNTKLMVPMEDEKLRNRYNELDDMLSTIGTGLLGLTIGCARCHDHKFDPIPTRDYYRMLAALHSGDRDEVPIDSAGQTKMLAFRDFGSEPKTSWLFKRGDFYDRDEPVQVGFLTVLTTGKTPEQYWESARAERPLANSTYQRKAVADWITDVDHGAGPLLARVIVNRVWQHHFGEGLVHSVSDFGVQGERPSHPELLEWLAQDFVAHGWKIKRLLRLILISAVYQQGNAFDAAQAKVDPENRLLWRMRPQRLEAEILRDAMLAVSGTLNLEPYGPAFKPPIAIEAMVARNLKDPYPKDIPDTAATRRRSVYMFYKRVVPYPLLQAFDTPDAQQSCGRRNQTTVAPQALALLNDPFVRDRALDFADRLLEEGGSDPARCVERGYRLALSRPPSATEIAASLDFIQTQDRQRAVRDRKRSAAETRRLALADFCQTLFSLNEFVYVN